MKKPLAILLLFFSFASAQETVAVIEFEGIGISQNEAKATRIILHQKINPNEKENWDKCFKWYSDTLEKFREAFVPRLRNL